MNRIVFRTVQTVALGGCIGSVTGFLRGIATISSNDYFHFGLKHLAGKVLFNEVLQWTITGLLATAVLVGVVFAAWPVAWLLRRKRDRAWGGALAAPVMLVLLAVVGYWINHEFLPGLFTIPSIASNIVIVGASLAAWFPLAAVFDHVAAAERPPRLLRKGAIAAVPTVLVLLLTGQVTKWTFPPSPPLANSPNILVILIDALRADRMSVYGYERQTTPNLERLADDGMLFTHAISQASWTKPAVASLFTGMYPRQHSIASSDWGRSDAVGRTLRVDTLSPEVQTIAEMLSNAGYHTAAIGSNHHLTTKTGFDQGFGYFEMDLDEGEHSVRSPETNELFLRWLERHGDDNFFAYLHYIDVHWPYRAPPPYSGMYAGSPPELDYNRRRFIPDHNENAPAEFDPAVLQHMLDTYDEGIRFTDDKIGEIIEFLKRRGLYEDMLIVVTSDHGEEFREHGKLAHGHSLFDEIVRVPLIIKLPSDSGRYPQVVKTQVELIDILPTILQSVGLPAPEGLFGRHVRSTNPDPEPAAFSELNNTVAIRTPEYKYIYDFDSGMELLYDLIEDPGEQQNLAAAQPQLAEELRGRLFDWIAMVDLGLSVRGEQVELDEDAKRELEALGYVE